MYTANGFGIHGTLSAVLAAAIVAVSGLALDRAHLAAAPAGIVEVGELAPIDALPQVAMLDEIVVSAGHTEPARHEGHDLERESQG